MTQTLLMQNLAEQLLLEDTTPEDIDDLLALLNRPDLLELTHPPVDFRTFVESPYFLNSANVLYPEVLRSGSQLNNGDYEEAVLTGGIGCVDKDTEFLSTTGWIPISNWSGQPVLQVSATGKGTFVIPSEYIVLPCTSFYHLHTKYGVDQVLSPEHRVWYKTTKGNWGFTLAQTLYEQHQGSVKGWTGKFATTATVSTSTSVPLSNAQIRVQVMLQADGHFPTHLSANTNYVVVKVKKKRKQVRARELLESACIPYTESSSVDGYIRFGFQAPIKTKRYEEWAWGCSCNQLQVIARECLLWDGSRDSFYSTVEADADFIQYAMLSVGVRPVKVVDDRQGKPRCWEVRGNPNTEIGIQGVPVKTPIDIVPSVDGKKYCFTVPEGRFLIRRGGKTVVTGNTGKTTLALFSTAYQLYHLSCYINPQKTFGLDPSSEIVFIFQSLNAKLAKAVDYDRFKDMISKSPYFKQQFEFDKTILSELRFPHRIIVKPISGNETGAIGQNVIGGIIDEINFMSVIGSSKQAADGGTYDQAIELYNAISRRRKSRFLAGGRMPGLLCLVSSKRTPGQFTDRKEAQAKTNPRLFVYDKRVWDVKPGSFSGVVFSVFIGDQTRKPRILDSEDVVAHADRHLIDRIPIEFKQEFQDDITKALRDIAGRATNAIHPFMADTERVTQNFGKIESVLTVSECDFISTRPGILPSRIVNRDYPRFVHLDLSLTGDSTGVVIGHCPMFRKIKRVEAEEMLPVIQIDCVLEVLAPKGGEIEYHKIRHLLYKLRELGMPIRWVTLDSYQSADTMQVLRTEGFQTGYQSLDTTMVPYVVTKAALYDGRVLVQDHQKLKIELTTLERDFKKSKIDHSAHGSKDLADALAGVVYGLSMRKDIWLNHGVNPVLAPSLNLHLSERKDEDPDPRYLNRRIGRS